MTRRKKIFVKIKKKSYRAEFQDNSILLNKILKNK